MAKRLAKKYHKRQQQNGLFQEDTRDKHAAKRYPAWIRWYDRRYKVLLLIPLILFLLAALSIGIKYETSGDFLNKDVTLKGGLTMTLYDEVAISPDALRQEITQAFPQASVSISVLRDLDGSYRATQIFASGLSNEGLLDLLKVKAIISETPDYEVTQTESAFSEQFFRQIIFAMLFAFLFMSITVYVIYRNLATSFAVIFAALADILITLAIFNMADVALGAASIAGFLMLIGYSVDTDILLSTRMLREKSTSHLENIIDAAKTGMTMTLTTLAAVSLSYLFTPSEVLRQIMLVILVGLLVDLVTTWIMNAGILRWYLERRS